MKKVAIIGSVLLLVGIVIFAVGFLASGRDFTTLNMSTHGFRIDISDVATADSIEDIIEHETVHSGNDIDSEHDSASEGFNEYNFDPDGVSAIKIIEGSSDVKLGISTDELIHIICYEDSANWYTFEYGNTLAVKKESSGGIKFSIDFSHSDRDLRLMLPESMLSGELALVIETGSGDVELDKSAAFSRLSVLTGSGDVEISDITASRHGA
jgi:hypothetical protein